MSDEMIASNEEISELKKKCKDIRGSISRVVAIISDTGQKHINAAMSVTPTGNDKNDKTRIMRN